jgi:hypothetical protein
MGFLKAPQLSGTNHRSPGCPFVLLAARVAQKQEVVMKTVALGEPVIQQTQLPGGGVRAQQTGRRIVLSLILATHLRHESAISLAQSIRDMIAGKLSFSGCAS